MNRILIVDDKEENLYYLRALLAGHGCAVEDARHGAEALVKARRSPPDLIVSDLLMPVMDGYTLLRLWKSDASLKKIPFIVYTATYTEPADEQLALSLGADAFILKPAEPEVFLARIRDVQTRTGSLEPLPPNAPRGDEKELLKVYSETLIRKLEEKTLQLEESNRALQKDIAERKKAEEALRLLHSAVMQSKESILITDAELNPPGPRIQFVNPAFTQMTGYTPEEIIGKTPRLLQGPRTDRAVLNRLRATLERGEVFNGQTINYRKDGSEYVQEWQIAPLRDDAGAITHFVALQRDMTEQRKLEEQYRQAQKMEGIGQMAGGIAHDFNNILTVIQGHCALLQSDEAMPAALRESADEIQLAAERAANLTRQLLMFSRRQTMMPRDLDLNEVIANIGKMLKRILPENIHLQLLYAPQPLILNADGGMLDQILMNLTINARDAMPKGGRLIIETLAVQFDERTAAAQPQARPGQYVCLRLSDTGTGIAPEDLPHIFEPFFTTKAVGKGTGLGLATTFGIVQQHQGWITVDSTLNRGTTFQVFLPRLAQSNAQGLGVDVQAELRGGTETILLAEDDPSLRAMVRNILSRLGYRILEASTGVAALQIWKEHQRDIRMLLTDMVMPDGISGLDLAEQLLRDQPKLKIIYTTGYSAELSEKETPHRVDLAILPKPFTSRQLADLVRAGLDG